jgi:hypothetical protein
VGFDLPIWLLIFLPYLTTPGWALFSFIAVGALTYRWARGRKRRGLWAFFAAVLASFSLPTAWLLLLEAGAPAIVCAITGLALLLVVLYLRSKPRSEQ